MHGLPDLVRSRTRNLRIFWAIFLTLVLICASYHCSLVISSALSQPSVTKVQYHKVHNLSYPIVTICDKTGQFFLDRNKLEADNLSHSSIQLILLSGPFWLLSALDYPSHSLLNDTLAHQTLLSFVNESKSSGNLLRDFLLKYSIDCRTLFYSCRDANWQRLDCCKYFRPVIHLRHGLCYASDTSIMPRAKASGLFSNFFVKLRRVDTWELGNESKINQVHDEPPSLSITIDTGIDQGMWRADSIDLPYGIWDVIKVSAKRITSELTEDHICEFHPKLDYFKDYTFSNCMWEKRFLNNPLLNPPCFLPTIQLTRVGFDFPTLNFTNFEVVNGSAMAVCSADEIIRYFFNATESTFKLFSRGKYFSLAYWMSQLLMSDSNPCPDPCDHWEFDYSESRDYEYKDEDYSGFTLTFTESEYEHVSEVRALAWQDYLSLIGGTWGLWCGASIVTFTHLIISLIQMFVKSSA